MVFILHSTQTPSKFPYMKGHGPSVFKKKTERENIDEKKNGP
jgi:hypothetical protein